MTEKNTWQTASQVDRKNPKTRHIFQIFSTLLVLLLHHQTNYWLSYLEWFYFFTIELWRKKKINLCLNIWNNFNSEIISKYKNDKVKKIRQKVLPTWIPYLQPPFYNLWFPTPRKPNKIHYPLKKGRVRIMKSQQTKMTTQSHWWRFCCRIQENIEITRSMATEWVYLTNNHCIKSRNFT